MKLLISLEDLKSLLVGDSYGWFWYPLSHKRNPPQWWLVEWDGATRLIPEEKMGLAQFLNILVEEQPDIEANGNDQATWRSTLFEKGIEICDACYIPLDRRMSFTPQKEGRPPEYPADAFLQPGAWENMEVTGSPICP